MEKKQSELCLEILRRFNNAGVLDDLILIGSWCVYFYVDYFSDVPYTARQTIKTRDLDFLIDNPGRMRHEVNIPELLEDLGFIIIYKGAKGYIKLEHPDLLLEFLVPERGKGIDKPVALPKLGLNAVALRFLSFLSADTITVKVEGFHIRMPHPANFALHKLIISPRRLKQDKAQKDRDTALIILRALIGKGEARKIRQAFDSVPKKWRDKILGVLNESEDADIIDVLA